MKKVMGLLILALLIGCQAVGPEYIKKVSFDVTDTSLLGQTHSIVAEYNAETGEFYQFAPESIVKSTIYIGYKPQSYSDLNLIADELELILNNMVRLKICSGEYISHQSKISDFSVNCFTHSNAPQIIWYKSSQYSIVSQIDYWTLQQMREMEMVKTKMRNTNILQVGN